MPIFKSEDEAVKAHEHYHLDTDLEGKYQPNHPGWLRTVVLVSMIRGGKVLGVGCNSGGLEKTVLRSRRGSIVYGVDVNPDLVKVACMKGVMAKVAKAEELPFPDEYFDTVILSEILEHVFDVPKVIKESLRVLKTGGVLVGSVPHPKGVNAQKGVENHPYHARIFTKPQLKNDLKGLKDLEIKDVPYTNDKKPQWMAFRGTK